MGKSHAQYLSLRHRKDRVLNWEAGLERIQLHAKENRERRLHEESDFDPEDAVYVTDYLTEEEARSTLKNLQQAITEGSVEIEESVAGDYVEYTTGGVAEGWATNAAQWIADLRDMEGVLISIGFEQEN